MQNKQIHILFLPLLIWLGGCSMHLTEDKRFVMTPVIDNSYPRATLVTASRDIVGKIKLLNPVFREMGKMTEAQVRVQNLSEDRYTLEYKFDWEDAQGFSTSGAGIWQRFTLVGGQTESFSSVGKTPDSKIIVFTVRLPDDVFIDLEKREAGDR